MSAAATGTGKLVALLGKDARGIARDRLMVFLLGYGVLIALAMRFLAPLVPLEGFVLYAAPGAPLIGSLLLGNVLGFSLIEERESRTWLLLRVLPLREVSLVGYLVGISAAVAVVAAAACAAVYGQPVVRPWLFAGALLSSALGAPLVMLVLATFAANKIEGMAVGKIFGVVMWAPILVFVVPAAWHPLLYWDPWYWFYLALLRGHADDSALAAAPLAYPAVPDALLVAIPTALSLAACAWLVRRFQRIAA